MRLLCLLALLVTVASGAHIAASSTNRVFTDDENESLSRYIKALLENLKAEMPKGIPQLGIPPLEPLHMPEIRTDIQEGVAKINLHMLDLIISGLSSFVVREVKGDMNTMTFSLDLFIPEINGQSHYDVDGKVLIFPIYGKGMAGLKVNDLHFKGSATISIIDMKMVQLTNFNLNIEFSNIQLYLENIVGGGNLGNVVNTLMNMLGKLLYDKFKNQLLPALNNIIKNALNAQLAKIKLQDLIGGSANPPATAFSASPVQDSVNTYIDRLLENLRPFIRQNGMDPLGIPDQRTEFSQKVWFVTWHGGAVLYEVLVRSLSTIHRTNNFQMQAIGQRLTMEGEVGVNRLFGSGRVRAWFMSINIYAGLEATVEAIRVRARIQANIGNDMKASLDLFSITHVGAIGIKVTGLGVLDWILGSIANLAVNALRGKIVQAIESPIRDLINKELEKLKMPDFAIIY